MPQLISEISGYLDNGISSLKKADKELLEKLGIKPKEDGNVEIGIDEFRHANKEAIVDEFLKEDMQVLNNSFVIKEASYISFSYTEVSKRAVEAIYLREIKEREGEAAVVEERKNADKEIEISRGKRTRAEADLFVKQKEAEADAYEMKVHLEAIGSHPFGGQIEIAQIEKDRATAIARAHVDAMKELRQFQGKALVVGDKGGGVMLSLDDDEPRKREKDDDRKDKKGESK